MESRAIAYTTTMKNPPFKPGDLVWIWDDAITPTSPTTAMVLRLNHNKEISWLDIELLLGNKIVERGTRYVFLNREDALNSLSRGGINDYETR